MTCTEDALEIRGDIRRVVRELNALQKSHKEITGEWYAMSVSDPAPGGINPQPKEPQFRSDKYLKWLRGERCYGCGRTVYLSTDGKPKRNDAAHQRQIGTGGTSMKPGDIYALPGCLECHNINEHLYGQKLSREEAAVKCLAHINRYLITGGKF